MPYLSLQFYESSICPFVKTLLSAIPTAINRVHSTCYKSTLVAQQKRYQSSRFLWLTFSLQGGGPFHLPAGICRAFGGHRSVNCASVFHQQELLEQSPFNRKRVMCSIETYGHITLILTCDSEHSFEAALVSPTTPCLEAT
jgi:hypothetical protein